MMFANATEAMAWASINHVRNINAVYAKLKTTGSYRVNKKLLLRSKK